MLHMLKLKSPENARVIFWSSDQFTGITCSIIIVGAKIKIMLIDNSICDCQLVNRERLADENTEKR